MSAKFSCHRTAIDTSTPLPPPCRSAELFGIRIRDSLLCTKLPTTREEAATEHQDNACADIVLVVDDAGQKPVKHVVIAVEEDTESDQSSSCKLDGKGNAEDSMRNSSPSETSETRLAS